MELIFHAISESDFQITLNLINGMAHASLKVNESQFWIGQEVKNFVQIEVVYRLLNGPKLRKIFHFYLLIEPRSFLLVVIQNPARSGDVFKGWQPDPI
jgi:hypothetical protein